MWFFSRAGTIPADLAGTSTTITPSNWGEPTAQFPFGASCQEGPQIFAPQQLIITTTLVRPALPSPRSRAQCGQWAGIPSICA